MDESRPAPEGTTRRAALRAGAAIAWSVPVVTVLGTSAAHADLASGPAGTVPPPPGGTVPPPPSALPSVVPTPAAPAATTAPATAAPSVAAAPAARGQVLAATGAEALPLGLAGLGLVAGGAAVVAAARHGRADGADDQA